MKAPTPMSNAGWMFRTYSWKGVECIAVYRNRAQLGAIKGSVAMAHELANGVGGTVVELGEVREEPTIQVKQWTVYEPFKVIGNGWGKGG